MQCLIHLVPLVLLACDPLLAQDSGLESFEAAEQAWTEGESTRVQAQLDEPRPDCTSPESTSEMGSTLDPSGVQPCGGHNQAGGERSDWENEDLSALGPKGSLEFGGAWGVDPWVLSANDPVKCEACLKAAEGDEKAWNTYCDKYNPRPTCYSNALESEARRKGHCYNSVCER